MSMRGVDNPKETQSQNTGLLYMEGENSIDGYRLSKIAPNSPLTNASVPLKAGDVIVSFDREPVTENVNIYSLLVDKADTEVPLEILRDGKSLETIVCPATNLSMENYDTSVESRRDLVGIHSNGRLGYLHIGAMGRTSFERFQTELVAAGFGKEGIVIDVRYNGGGWRMDYLMAVLIVEQHACTIPP